MSTPTPILLLPVKPIFGIWPVRSRFAVNSRRDAQRGLLSLIFIYAQISPDSSALFLSQVFLKDKSTLIRKRYQEVIQESKDRLSPVVKVFEKYKVTYSSLITIFVKQSRLCCWRTRSSSNHMRSLCFHQDGNTPIMIAFHQGEGLRIPLLLNALGMRCSANRLNVCCSCASNKHFSFVKLDLCSWRALISIST